MGSVLDQSDRKPCGAGSCFQSTGSSKTTAATILAQLGSSRTETAAALRQSGKEVSSASTAGCYFRLLAQAVCSMFRLESSE